MTKPAGIIEIDPGEFLKRKMGSASLNGVQLAKRIDCHVQTIYNVTTKGRTISPRLADDWARQLVQALTQECG